VLKRGSVIKACSCSFCCTCKSQTPTHPSWAV